MADLGNHFYIISLVHKLDYERALFGGPWIISNHYLTVQKWYLNFETTSISKMVAWITIPHSVFKLFTKRILTKISCCFSRVLQIDETTLNQNRAQFARIGVEIDLNKPL